jgi:hypothetical protein
MQVDHLLLDAKPKPVVCQHDHVGHHQTGEAESVGDPVRV